MPRRDGPSHPEMPLASVGAGAPATSDPALEEILVDRLIDRMEERLRHHAMRHLGVTGGLT